MQATLTWLDLTASDRDKMRRVLDLFKEQGTLDEMGLGSLRDALSDALFPGTSSIQTRLRYVLFVPWLYRRLEGRRVIAQLRQTAPAAAPRRVSGQFMAAAAGLLRQMAPAAVARDESAYWSLVLRYCRQGNLQAVLD